MSFAWMKAAAQAAADKPLAIRVSAATSAAASPVSPPPVGGASSGDVAAIINAVVAEASAAVSESVTRMSEPPPETWRQWFFRHRWRIGQGCVGVTAVAVAGSYGIGARRKMTADAMQPNQWTATDRSGHSIERWRVESALAPSAEVRRQMARWCSFLKASGTRWSWTFHEPYFNDEVVYRISPSLQEEISRATYVIHGMCLELVDEVASSPTLLRKLDIPEDLWAHVYWSWQRRDPDLIGRMDFALFTEVSENSRSSNRVDFGGGQGQKSLRLGDSGEGANRLCSSLIPKLLEYNADTPTVLVEAGPVQRLWLSDHNEQRALLSSSPPKTSTISSSSTLAALGQFNKIFECLSLGYQAVMLRATVQNYWFNSVGATATTTRSATDMDCLAARDVVDTRVLYEPSGDEELYDTCRFAGSALSDAQIKLPKAIASAAFSQSAGDETAVSFFAAYLRRVWPSAIAPETHTPEA